MEKKYTLKEATVEDQKAFGTGLNNLLEELNLVLSLEVIKKGISFKGEGEKMEVGFIDSPTMVIRKKVEQVEVEAEVIKENEIHSEN